MLIYESLEAVRAGEPGLVVTAQDETAPFGTFEADWGYRLRGAGLPGGEVGWLLTFAGTGSGFASADGGWLIAYAIAHNVKTGRVAVVRRGWDTETDRSELHRVRALDEWDHRERHSVGEADIEWIDEILTGPRLG